MEGAPAQEEGELCARRAKALGWGKIHCLTQIAHRDLGADYDAPRHVVKPLEKRRREQVKELGVCIPIPSDHNPKSNNL